MKQLIRRLSRVADASSQYSLLSSDTASTRHRITRRAESFRIAVASLKKPVRRSVPEGHVPVYVGEEMERFLVNAELLNHPVFVSLLNKSAQEYGTSFVLSPTTVFSIYKSEAGTKGHVPVYVGEEMERFLVNAELLNHPVFVSLLNKSAQEYGYDQKGVLHIPCHVLVFERVMEALRLGADLRDLQDLLRSFSDDCFLDL
ncbi:hypothetical protein GOBAR_AA24255 [Gossypium barbadense]|uniref:Uncharacterized protein n=1 Tax=Gossypium barbadense TaxID=3634 RepID=A0A2P5WZA2_GOSBA|nr:hypothetical protein GOBAR_AA24255 [Gossypium barbadense]